MKGGNRRGLLQKVCESRSPLVALPHRLPSFKARNYFPRWLSNPTCLGRPLSIHERLALFPPPTLPHPPAKCKVKPRLLLPFQLPKLQ